MPELKETKTWNSPIPKRRWEGFRQAQRGLDAFSSLESFAAAQASELEESLDENELKTLGRLLKRGNKLELDVFIHSHGANPIFNPQEDIDFPVGVARADVVELEKPADPKAQQAILNGDVVHVLFHAGEASRFQQGPFYTLNPVGFTRAMKEKSYADPLERIEKRRASLPAKVGEFLVDGALGPKQPLMIRAALRRIVYESVEAGQVPAAKAASLYRQALNGQKILFFINPRGIVGEKHEEFIRKELGFFGFNPNNVITIEQELVPGLTVDEEGRVSLRKEDLALDAAGHLYALIQAVRPGAFTAYTDLGRPAKPSQTDALAHLSERGGKILNIIRINDMDRHTTEIINSRAIGYALAQYEKGFVNVIEGVANPSGQKGGTGATFGDPTIHVLTETHENSFPSYSRAFEAAMKAYLKESGGRHPAYNAMRQIADLTATREALKNFGGRIVFVPRCKEVKGVPVFYMGVDMPMGDLSLLYSNYKSHMFQFVGPKGRELHIHDMKTVNHLPVALRTIERQLEDPFILEATEELLAGRRLPFKRPPKKKFLYGAPAPEFEGVRSEKGVNERSRWRAPQKDQGGQKQ